MWKEYAIEPACVVQSRETFRFLLSNFGTEHGRWIIRLPGEWKKQVTAALASSPLRDVDRARVIEWMKMDKGRFFGAGGDAFDPRSGWLSNALRHHASRPFAKILATANPDTHVDVMVPDTQDDWSTSLSCPHQISVPRTTADIVRAVSPLLAKAQELILIDPHFSPETNRFLDVLQAVLREIARRPQKPTRIEYHFKATISTDGFRRDWQPQIIRALPAGITVSFIAWDERPNGEKLHDRFILAPIGGVEVSVGLDTGEPGQSTGLTRMSAERHAKIWADYQHGKPSAAFDLAPGFPVTLQRP